MKFQDPIPHWNNFTVPALKDILEHCVALERLGIAQDEEMMVSMERDIALREKKASGRTVRYESENAKMKQLITHNHKIEKIVRKAKQQPQEILLS